MSGNFHGLDSYTKLSLAICKQVTNHYSTSFSLGIRMLEPEQRQGIYAIYGMVRIADEIVDTYFDLDQRAALTRFTEHAFQAIDEKYSSNPVLQAFQWSAHRFGIRHEWVEAFFASMEMDLSLASHTAESYERYVYGSAEVIGLMCVAVFCGGDGHALSRLEMPARKLGAAFQKVNFLRDLQSDQAERGRHYFPQLQTEPFSMAVKRQIEKEIEADFQASREGMGLLPGNSRRAVRLTYQYYYELFSRIREATPETILSRRMRVGDARKLWLLVRSLFR